MSHFDWTTISDDPNNAAAKSLARDYLDRIRQLHLDGDLMDFILAAAAGKRVLDIGVAAHAMRYVDRDDFRHRRIAGVASECLGIDILAPLVEELGRRGFNVRCVDATSEIDLGARFDVVFIGDVVEHVDNPVALLRFAARHLTPGGRILVATPNPFSRKFFRQFRAEGAVVVNLDHLTWFTPTMALELGRRSGIPLVANHLIKPIHGWSRVLKRVSWRIEPVEYSFPDFLFEFAAERSGA